MAILRNKSQNKYTIISNSILSNSQLSLKERGLICTLLSLPDNWDFSFAGLLKILPDGQKSLQSGLKKLEELGYLRRTRIKDIRGRFADFQWEVYETPQNVVQSSNNVITDYAISSCMDKADTEMTDMETEY